MLDPVVHAALVTVFIFLIDLLFKAIGVDFGNEVLQALAEVLVGYILSLFGYSGYKYLTNKARGITNTNNQYAPPFTS